MATLESKWIPVGIESASVVRLRSQAKQTFSKFTPRSLGHALRISRITPADVTVFAVHFGRN